MLRVKDSLPIPELASLHKDQPLVQLVVNHFTENPLKKKKKNCSSNTVVHLFMWNPYIKSTNIIKS